MSRGRDIDDDPSVEERTQPVRTLGGVSRRSRGEGRGQVHVSADGPFAAGSISWRDRRGKLQHTIVAKVSYELSPGVCAELPEPIAVQAEDGHWDDDPGRSVHTPSDLAPFKAAPEVVIVGSAYAPSDQPRQSVTARVVVGSVDKAVVAWSPRRFRADGSIEELPRQARFSLRWEHAAGGPGSENPAGIDMERADARGRRAIPEILPVVFDVQRPGDFVPAVGLGPIAAGWPPRQSYVGEADRAWVRAMRDRPLPEGFPARYFQVAPPDQWLDRPFAANERIVLEGLHDSVPRLVTSLAGIEPWAVVFGSADEPVRLLGDLLVIDSDRSIATLTFRGQVQGDETGDLRVVILGVPMGAPPPLDALRAMGGGARRAPPPPVVRGMPPSAAEGPEHDEDWSETTSLELVTSGPSLPFGKQHAPQAPKAPSALPFAPPAPAAQAPPPPPPRPSYPDGALPFPQIPPARSSSPRGSYADGALPFRAQPAPPLAPAVTFGPPPTTPPAAPVTFGPPPVPPMPPMPPPVAPTSFGQSASVQPALTIGQQASRGAAPPQPPTVGQHASGQPSGAPVDALPPPPPPVASLLAAGVSLASPSPNVVAKPAGVSPKSAAPREPAASTTPRARAAATAEAPTSGVQAASDAAAAASREAEKAKAGGAAKKEGSRRLAVVDLIHLQREVAPRVRAMKRFAPIFAAAPKPRALGIDEQPKKDLAEKDRADTLRVLCYGRPDGASQVRDALADSLEDADLDAPLVLVAGQLRPTFDELETLKITIAVVQSVAGNDKRILGAVALGQEAVSSSVGPRPDAALGLARQIAATTGGLSIPIDYVPSQVERALVEGRKYKRRILRGSPRYRADIALAHGGEVFPLYLPEAILQSLPLLPSCPVIALCEVRLREDAAEATSEALFPTALGRVVYARGD